MTYKIRQKHTKHTVREADLTTSRAECQEIWGPKPGTLSATPGLLRDSLYTKRTTIYTVMPNRTKSIWRKPKECVGESGFKRAAHDAVEYWSRGRQQFSYGPK
jgi:hypothetical protein